MANIGSSELFLLFVVALLVLGPERLPEVAGRVGRWVGRARRMAEELRRQLEREVSRSEKDENQGG
jgi:sec-independent protein translocase protein TatB